MKITIGRKIAIPFFVMFMLIVVAAGITYQGFKKVSASLDNMELETVKQGKAGNLRFNITHLLMPGNDYIITQDQYYQREFDHLNLVVDNAYHELNQLSLTDEERCLLNLLKQDLDSIRVYSAQIFSIPNPRRSPKAWALMETMDYHFGAEVNRKTTQIFDGISKRVKEHRQQVADVKENVMNSIIAATFLSIFISIIVTFLTVRRISTPIVMVAKAANLIANGNYSHRVVIKTDDEIALLAKSFNVMAESIQRSQKALEESKRFTESIIEAEPECVKVIDPDGTLLSINPAGLRMIEADSPEQVIGKSVYPFVVPEHRQAFQDLTQNVCRGAEGTLQFEIVGMKGRRCWLETHAVPLRDEAGRVSGELAITRDITERKQAEEELHKIGTAIEQTADCVVITDREGIIQYVNLAFTKIFRYSKEEAIGKTPRILKSGLHPPEFYQKLWKTILSGEVFTETFINKSKEGELVYELKTITPIKDKEGNITHFVSTAKDITKQRRAEQEIISQKNRFAQLFENSPIAIALLDDQDKIIHINESFSALFGYYLEEIRGKFLTDLIVPPELKEEAKSYSDQTREGNQINKESYRKKKDGTLVYVQIIGVPVAVNDKTVGIYGMYVDLTQRKDAEDKIRIAKELAEQSDKLKSEFLAQMSHEIRTPINIMAGNVDYLKDLFSENMDADARDCFEGIDLASKRIIRTIDLTLNAAELQTGGYNPQFVKIDLNSEVLNKLYHEHQLSAKQKGLELIYRCELKETKILADEYSVNQIFANLVDNAIKYTKKGKVEILLDKNISGNIMVEIKDTGIGMSKEFLPKLFEPFVQEEQGYTRAYDGNGLGLTLVKKYCDINNAVIEVESEKNVGSTFRVIFRR